jgi:hypothetical protein
MSEHATAGGLLGYAARLWAELPEAAITRVAGAGPGVPEERRDVEVAVPAPRAAGGRRIEA